MNAERWKATVHVGGLAPMVTKEHIHDAFLPFGEIVEVSLPTPNRIQQQQNQAQDPNAPVELHRGFAYVEFEDVEDAKEAIDNMDQSELFGRVLKVSTARIPKSAEEGLNSKTAVWEQEGWLAQNTVGDMDTLGSANDAEIPPADPMQGLEGLDVAGPKPQ